MNLLFPQFLYGLIALAIPIIIHLFNFRRTKKVYFSNNRFLTNIKESNSSRLKIKHLLVLFSRLLFLFFMVMAFTQPYISSKKDFIPNNHVKVYIDNSFSMSNKTANELAAIDQALIYAEAIASQYPKSARFQLYTNEFDVSSERIMSHEAFLDALTEVKLSPVTRNFEEIMSRMKRRDGSRDVIEEDHFLLTDFQSSTFAINSTVDIDTVNNYSVVPITFSNTSNLFVDSLYLSNPFLLKDDLNELIISIRNTGAERIEEVITKLVINEEQVGTAALTIEPNTAEDIKFEINFNLQDENLGIVTFEDFPVTFDNSFYFTLNTSSKINIVDLQGKNATEVLSQVYANNSLFGFESFDIDNFDYNLLNTADLVFLNEVDEIHQALQPVLQDYIENGGALVVIFGEKPSLISYSFLRLPEDFSLAHIADKPSLKNIDQPDYNNPFFQNIFNSSEENIEMPLATNTVNWRTDGNKILSYRNGIPFIAESAKDNIFIIGAPFNDRYTNFHRQALFVPVMYRLAALSQTGSEKLYYEISDPQIQLKKENIEANDILKFRRDEIEIIPSQFIINNTVFLEIPKYTLDPGFYSLLHEEDTIRYLAFNYSKVESLLKQINEKELIETFENRVKIYEQDKPETFKAELKDQYTGKQLWKYCLGLALFFLFLEISFIRFL